MAAPKEEADRLDRGMRRLANIMSSERITDGAVIGQAAKEIEQTADALTVRFVSQDFNSATTLSLIQALVRDIRRIANSGVNLGRAGYHEPRCSSLGAFSTRHRQARCDHEALRLPGTSLGLQASRDFAVMYQTAVALIK